jgi:hypothetical protein
MDFEEFFRKKKIDLVALEQGEPALFSEFKIHFGQMGEKSFDHTKKYWFNKLRLRFPAPVETKVERVVIENQLAEQTVTESLVESSTPPPNIGFKPKFRAGVTKPVEETQQTKENTEQATTPPPNVGFKPRFKAGVTKPAEENPKTEPAPEKPAENTEQTTSPPNIGFKPRFKAGVTKPAEQAPAAEPTPAPEKPAEDTEQTAPPAPLGFKPKFKAGVTKTVSPAPEEKEEPKAETPPAADQSTESNETKPAYKPRFNMKNIKPKGEE